MSKLLERSSLIDLWREEGREEGKEWGKIEEKMNTARELFINGAELAFVEKITKLPLDKLREIEKSVGEGVSGGDRG